MMERTRTGLCPTLAFAAATWFAAAGTTAAEKPQVPPLDPIAGPAVVMLTTGIDYTKPSVARKLARDGEGELVGWDAVDKDRRPYGTDPVQSRLVEIAPSRVIPVRIDPQKPASLTEASDFVRRTQSRVVVVPLPLFDVARNDLAPLFQVADLLIIVAGSLEGRQIMLPEAARDRVIVVGALSSSPLVAMASNGLDVILLPPAAAREAPGDAIRAPSTPDEAAILFVAQLSCRKSELSAAKDARAAKRLLLAAAKHEPHLPAPVLEDCTRSLGPR